MKHVNNEQRNVKQQNYVLIIQFFYTKVFLHLIDFPLFAVLMGNMKKKHK